MKTILTLITSLLSLSLLSPFTDVQGQSIVAVQGQAGFAMCTKTGEIYIVNANTGTAKLLTIAPLAKAINSLATDTSKGIIYYCYNDYISTNKSIYGYNYRTNTHFTLINDLTTAPGSPIIGIGGVGTAGATFYKGSLYFGVELARSLSPAVPNIGTNVPYSARMYKITMDAAGTSIIATSLVKDYYTDNGYISYSSSAMGSTVTSFYKYDTNWGDFVIINDTLYDRSVKGNTCCTFLYEQTTVAYALSAPAVQVYNTLTLPATTVLNDGFSYVQTASDGDGNLVLVGNEGNTNQFFVKANKANGTYSVVGAKPLTVNGSPFAIAVTDCSNVIAGEGTIGDKVWYDQNENGIKDITEIGLFSVPVELWEDVNNNGVIDEAADKLLGTATTALDGSYGFIHMLQGNYLVRCVLTTSVNYPTQGFTASYPANPLASSASLVDAGDEFIAGANTTNLVNKSFSTLVFNDQKSDFGYANVFIILTTNKHNLKASYTNHKVKLNWELLMTGVTTVYAIERSLDGKTYSNIANGTIKASGTNIPVTNWDLNIPRDVQYLYYRLILIDNNGKVEKSNTVLVKISYAMNEQVTVFPNPAKYKTTLSVPQNLVNETLHATIINYSGQVSRKYVITWATKTQEIDLSDIKQGFYFLRITSDKKQQVVFSGKLEIL